MAGMTYAVVVHVILLTTTAFVVDVISSAETPTTKGGQVATFLTGPHGLPGRDGIQGNPGIPGIPGRQALKGTKGDVGIGMKGNAGSPGFPGKDGPRGVKGHIGVKGNIGVKGDAGVKGDIGVIGDIGVKGDAGVKGAKGRPGIADYSGPGISGVTYIQWGRKQCSAVGVQTVYSGVAAGSYYSHTGGGANTQCLPLDPTWGYYKDGVQGASSIYGTEYDLWQGIQPFINKGLLNHDVPCAICYAPNKNTQFMLPAKNICPTGWSREYYGYLMAERYNHHRSMYLCVDHNAEPTGSNSNHNGNTFYPVEAQCGSLPCPPYVDGREMTCAVCTK